MHMFQIHYFFFGCAINACFKDQPTLEICSTSNLLSESLRHASSISFSASWQKCLKTNKYFYEFAGSTNCEQKPSETFLHSTPPRNRMIDSCFEAYRDVRRGDSDLEITCCSSLAGKKRRGGETELRVPRMLLSQLKGSLIGCLALSMKHPTSFTAQQLYFNLFGPVQAFSAHHVIVCLFV